MGQSTGSDQQPSVENITATAAGDPAKQRTAAREWVGVGGRSADTEIPRGTGTGTTATGDGGGGGGTTPTPTDENPRAENSGLVGVEPPKNKGGRPRKTDLPKLVPAGAGASTPPPIEKTLTKEQEKYRRRKEREAQKRAEAVSVTGFDGSKPAAVKATAKQSKDIENLITTVIAGGFGFAATKAGNHWMLSQPEAQSLSQPLTRMLEKYDFFAKLAEHSDAAALVTAAAMIVTPRVLQTAANNRHKPKEVKNNVQPIQTARGAHTKNTDASPPASESGDANGGFTPSSSGSVKSVLAAFN